MDAPPDSAGLIRDARRVAGFTQAELAERLGVTQSAVAKLERPGSNPTVATLDRVLRATGHRLQLIAPSWGEVDFHALRANLERTPEERLREGEELTAEALALQREVGVLAR